MLLFRVSLEKCCCYVRLCVSAIFILLAMSNYATAAVFEVDSTRDIPDKSPLDLKCADEKYGKCTLRAAIQQANHSEDQDHILLPAGTYSLGIMGTGYDAGDFDITSPLVISGEENPIGATIIDGEGISRVFDIIGDINVGFEFLRIQNGKLKFEELDGDNGGGIRNDSGKVVIKDCIIANNSTILGAGGGIYNNNGGLAIIQSTLKSNEALNGGGVANYEGKVTINKSTFHRNLANKNSVHFNGKGGGIFQGSSGSLTILTSTLFSNEAIKQGGGIYNFGAAEVIIRRSTIAYNWVSMPKNPNQRMVSNIHNNDSRSNVKVKIESTIISHTSANGSNCPSYGLTSLGYNLVSDYSCGLESVDDPLLGSFTYRVEAPGRAYINLRPDSPAIDNGKNFGGSDQLIHDRQIDGDSNGTYRSDIGAIEYYPILRKDVDVELVRLVPNKEPWNKKPVPFGSKGTYNFKAIFKNISGRTISIPFFEVLELTDVYELTANNFLIANLPPYRHATGAGGTGFTKEIKGIFGKNEEKTVEFIIGLQSENPFKFLVILRGQ